MDETPAATPIGAGATQRLSGTATGWAHTLATRVGDSVTISMLECPDDQHKSRWVGTKRQHPQHRPFPGDAAGVAPGTRGD